MILDPPTPSKAGATSTYAVLTPSSSRLEDTSRFYYSSTLLGSIEPYNLTRLKEVKGVVGLAIGNLLVVYTYLVAIATSKALRTYSNRVSSGKGNNGSTGGKEGDNGGIGSKGKREHRGGSRELLSKGNGGIGGKDDSGDGKLLNYSSSGDNGCYYYYYYLLGSIVEFSLAYIVVAYHNMV
ncbi:uncharacterized protein IWZ02DRAFT_434758 [Phyllosticta citriasiana]|uniref:uncharacterized protein n=1 Tax=Phyllosticta citriasiana TaxID=595635 RepID=UPI0030FD5274